jgi:peptidoglycan/xylan/chitin deacetylase (PgdA/CDA1 family)
MRTRAPDMRAPRSTPIALLAIVVASVATVLLPVGPVDAVEQTIVSITFDDGRASQANALPLLAEHGMRGTFYVNSGRIDKRGYLSSSQLAQMAAAGHEIASHTPDHTNVSTMTEAEAIEVICADVAALTSLGHAPISFAYPEGVSSPASQAAVEACGLSSGRGVGGLRHATGCFSCPLAQPLPPANPYHLATPPSVKSTTTLDDLKGYVTRAEQSGGGLVALVLHDVGTPGSLSTTVATLDAFLDWLAPRSAHGTVVATIGEVIGGGAPQPPPPPPPPPACEHDATIPATDPACTPPPDENLIVNASLEQRTTSGPACFSRSGFGTATFTWEATTEARTGQWAERLTVTSITSGDRKLVPTMSAACAPGGQEGVSYEMSVWYRSTVTSYPVTYYLDATGTWRYWSTFAAQPASAEWQKATWVTAPLPAGATAMSFGLAVKAPGTLTVDDFALSRQ